jgi:hypothetical protein
MEEAARLRVPPVAVDAGDTRERDRIGAERERTMLLFTKGHIGEARLDSLMSELDAQLATLDASEALLDLPTDIAAIDWAWSPPEAINRVLRALWERVGLGADLLPVAAVWRVPKWRDR